MKYTVFFSIVSTLVCIVSCREDDTRAGQKVKRTLDNLGYYAAPYFAKLPDHNYQFSQYQLPHQKDPYPDAVSFTGYRSSFSAPFAMPVGRSDISSENPSHSSEYYSSSDDEDIDDEYPHSYFVGPSGNHKSAEVSRSQEQERVNTGYEYSDKPSYHHPMVNGYDNYCPQPALPQPILPSNLPMLRPELPYPVIRDRVNTQKPKNYNVILDDFKNIAQQAGLSVDYLSSFPDSFELLKKQFKDRSLRPRKEKVLLNVFEIQDPSSDFAIEELKGNYKPNLSNYPLGKITNARGGTPNYGSQYSYGHLQNPNEYKYGLPKELQSTGGFNINEPYFRSYGSFPTFKASIL